MYRPRGYQEIKGTRFHENQHTKIVSFSTLPNCNIYTPCDIPATQFRYRLRRPQDQCVAGTIMLRKISDDITGNQNRDFPTCRAVPQPTAAPHAPYYQ